MQFECKKTKSLEKSSPLLYDAHQALDINIIRAFTEEAAVENIKTAWNSFLSNFGIMTTPILPHRYSDKNSSFKIYYSLLLRCNKSAARNSFPLE